MNISPIVNSVKCTVGSTYEYLLYCAINIIHLRTYHEEQRRNTRLRSTQCTLFKGKERLHVWHLALCRYNSTTILYCVLPVGLYLFDLIKILLYKIGQIEVCI